ncbi:MAG: hypothetical protein ACREV9_15370 [Burkholderiales bacterium]
MSQLKPPSIVERVAGNVVAESALTVLAAIAGGPLAPLLPVLAKSLASERQRARVEEAFADIGRVLEAHEAQIYDLTDQQYKIINEAVLALFQTTHSEKLKYLRAAVGNALAMRDVQPQEATVLSRVVRDISAEEAAFVIKNFSFDGFHLMAAAEGQQFTDNILRVNPASRDALIISGLLSLGLLLPAEPTYDAPNVLRFSSVVAKLIVLLRTDA